MEETFTFVTKFGLTIFSLLNPIGIIPVFLSITAKYNEQHIKKVSTVCSIAVFITMLVSVVIGEHILNFFGISIPSFRIAGGVLLAFTAFNMLNAQTSPTKLTENELDLTLDSSRIREIGIVPLAIPLLAGPGTISTCILYSQKIGSIINYSGVIAVLAVVAFIVKLILRYSRLIGEKMGTVGVNVMTRVMGLILMAMAVEFISTGIKQLF
jgi:multiple antibiotic resistance protein